jgi:hypothetical protein
MFLTLAQWELLVGGPGPSPQAFPLMLIMAYCLSWLVKKESLRWMLVLVINFLLIFTGYGIFMAGITVALLGLEVVLAWRLSRFKALTRLIALLVSLVPIAFFFRGYVFVPAAECYRFPYGRLSNYPLFIAMMLARFMGIKRHPVLAQAAGSILLTLLVVCLTAFALCVWTRGSEDTKGLIITTLIAYTLVQAVAVAVGRICFGMETSQSSRYMTLLIPAFLALYFALLGTTSLGNWRNPLLALLFIAVFAGSVQRNHKEMEGVASARRAWKQCYINSEDVDACTESAGVEIYLPTQHRQLQRALQYLKQNHLNLYATPR